MKSIEQIREELSEIEEDRLYCAMDSAGYERFCLDAEISEIRELQALDDDYILEFIEKSAKSENYHFDYKWLWKWINS